MHCAQDVLDVARLAAPSCKTMQHVIVQVDTHVAHLKHTHTHTHRGHISSHGSHKCATTRNTNRSEATRATMHLNSEGMPDASVTSDTTSIGPFVVQMPVTHFMQL